VTVQGTEPGQEFRDIRCSHSESLPALLTKLRLSVLISTYQTGHLIVVAAREGRLCIIRAEQYCPAVRRRCH